MNDRGTEIGRINKLDPGLKRLQIHVKGAVQGVGFRPFVYRLAHDLGLGGSVHNSPAGVEIEIEGQQPLLELFIARLRAEKPPHALINEIDDAPIRPLGQTGFIIKDSQPSGDKIALVLPDIATCSDCLKEIFDPANRRYLYPFTNCTNCGPRYSIIEKLPYDRQNTSMKSFRMCPKCQAEYDNPLDRRFHAQPNACPACGPQLQIWDNRGNVMAAHHKALLAACEAIKNGRIVAIKGLGGFQLVVDAGNDTAIGELRRRKARDEKPFALMFPDLALAKISCHVSELEEKLLTSSESPIVLLKRKSSSPVAPFISKVVAPDNPYLGVMLPYTPLHHLLMKEMAGPIVATSGNRADEPICFDEYEAFERLSDIADFFLVHDRPITRYVDDSILRVMAGREIILRRARGFAPLPVQLAQAAPAILAVGAQQKNCLAITRHDLAFISQHIGDLETLEAQRAFRNTADSLSQLFEFEPAAIACDLHPDYFSSQHAATLSKKTVAVQHHYAHILACLAENKIAPPVLGVCWDGTGHGLDGTIWGGEFLVLDGDSFERRAHLKTFGLPGGEIAIKEPRRAAAGVLYEIYGGDLFEKSPVNWRESFNKQERAIISRMLEQKINTPTTSSMGRLFDAVASITGICQYNSFEGQAAMKLEFGATEIQTDLSYQFDLTQLADRHVIDWRKMIIQILNDVSINLPVGEIAIKFHNTLAEIIVAVAARVDINEVVLTGGCFQNKLLTELAIDKLKANGFAPCWHRLVPPNDGGIALGQVAAALKAAR